MSVAAPVVAVLQARFSSSRLPGKVLKPILGEPMLARQIERVRRARRLDAVVLATSADESDSPVAEAARKMGVDVFRGSLDDVLDRFHSAVIGRNAAQIVRLTGDCPLADPAVIDRVIDLHLRDGNDYTSNINPPTFPDGLDVEVFTAAALERSWKEASLPSEREHVTPYMRTPGRFRTGSLAHHEDLSALRWTVDEADDFRFVTQVFERLYPSHPDFLMDDVLALLRREPELMGMNPHERNEGYRASLARDKGKKDV